MPFDQTTDPFSLIPLTTGQIVGNLAVALICGVVISALYRWSYRGTSYSSTFVASLITLAMITTVVIMAIGNNLARAFGLVGAMSIIRFRTAVKDTQDLVFIFLALSIGLAAGVGFHRLAFVGTFIVGGTLWVLGRTGYGAVRIREYLVELRTTDDAYREDREPEWEAVLQKYCRRHRLLHARSTGGGEVELAYLVRLIRAEDARTFTDTLTRVAGVAEVSLFHDEDQPL